MSFKLQHDPAQGIITIIPLEQEEAGSEAGAGLALRQPPRLSPPCICPQNSDVSMLGGGL